MTHVTDAELVGIADLADWPAQVPAGFHRAVREAIQRVELDHVTVDDAGYDTAAGRSLSSRKSDSGRGRAP